MWALLPALLLFQQGEHHYVDCIEIEMRNGIVYQTPLPVDEDGDFYSWKEGQEFFKLHKSNVRRVSYFSLLAPGPAPRAESDLRPKLRRIQGPILYQAGDTHYLKALHVDSRGRSREGRTTHNRVNSAKVTRMDSQSGSEVELLITKLDKDYRLELKLYDMEGRLLHHAFLALDELSQNRQERKQETAQYTLTLGPSIDLAELGLFEVIAFRKDR